MRVLSENNASKSIESENNVTRVENIGSSVIFFKPLKLANKRIKLSFSAACNFLHNFWKRQELRYRLKETFVTRACFFFP